MRVRDHVALSTAASTLLVPWLRSAVVIPWAASILIDVDHFLFFAVHERSLDAHKAVRYFNQAQPAQHAGTRVLHHPLVLLMAFALLGRWRWARLLLLGMVLHVGLDSVHGLRLRAVRAAALQRDSATCQRCGAQGPAIVAHLFRQPCLLPSYRPDNFISLCPRCHESAHAKGNSTLSIARALPVSGSGSPTQRGEGEEAQGTETRSPHAGTRACG